jgi:transcriptional regulator GlxA family with amidase domain
MNTMEIRPPILAAQNHVGLQINSSEVDTFPGIDGVIAYRSQHLNAPLQVGTLAARADLSQSHFTALFKRYAGDTPIDYSIRLRLRDACRLLERTDMSVKPIACAPGDDDPSYFPRIFKSFNRIPPSQYRLQKRKHGNSIVST